ncbi:MAG: response regulator [Verrucomicrobia bacterium]|nr:response regulator [Verrucomicrobiota bacterium]
MPKQPGILVVDDNTQVLTVFSFLLRSHGYEVWEATSGERCWALALEKHPDVILLDVVLPDSDGLEICKQLKSHPALLGTFVVLISALVTASEDRTKGLEAGADDYITRPIQMPEFIARVQSIVRIQQAEKGLRESEARWQSLVDNLPDLVVSVDCTGVIQFANRPRVGGAAGKLVGTSVFQLCPQSADSLREALRVALQTHEPQTVPIPEWQSQPAGEPVHCRVGVIRRGQRVLGATFIFPEPAGAAWPSGRTSREPRPAAVGV